MPSRKQRRRRAKDRRHEYEFVYVDDEGHEVEVEPEESEEPKASKAKAERKDGARKPASRNGAKTGAARTAARPVPPPSWRRVGKRSAIFAPFMLIAIYLLGGKKLNWAGRITETVFLLILFIPFSYLIDRMMYNRFVRQGGKEPAKPRAAGKPKRPKTTSRDDQP
jgi:hypothetical protein